MQISSNFPSRIATAVVLSVIAGMTAVPMRSTAKPTAQKPRVVAFLGVNLQNDNASYEPTSNAERTRMTALATQFKSNLESSGRYTFVAMTADVQKQIDGSQKVGACGGCETGYGEILGADTVAWIEVQKISNLIMNMNVYIADVPTAKMLFQHSVDVRGNTDETWSRSLAFLLKNYLPPIPVRGG